MNRRGFLTGLAAALAAPAIIRTPGLLMPIKPVVLKPVAYYATDVGLRSIVTVTGFDHMGELIAENIEVSLDAAEGSITMKAFREIIDIQASGPQMNSRWFPPPGHGVVSPPSMPVDLKIGRGDVALTRHGRTIMSIPFSRAHDPNDGRA